MVTNNITRRIYNTGLKTATEVNKEFVVRTKEFEAIWEDLQTSTMKFPEQDYFIVGERGMGKTMLLTKIKYSVQHDKKLSKWLIPITYPEEQNNVTELYDLWLNTAEYLGEDYPDIFCGLGEELENLAFNDETEERAFKILNNTLNQQNKKLLLLIDNFDEILKNISEKENRRLREIMITKNNLRIIGTSANAMEHNFRYDKAFYDHFVEINLKGLSLEETEELFRNKINDLESSGKFITNKTQKLKFIRNRFGGNIRNMIRMFDVLITNSNGFHIKDLEDFFEGLSPEYRNKLKSLKNKQRKIVDFLAKTWEGTFVKEIAEGTRMKSNEVAAQLKVLEENQIVFSKESSTRKKLYFLKDRFFSIWYLMCISTSANQYKQVWLTDIYQNFYSEEELMHLVEDVLQKLKSKSCVSPQVIYDAFAFLNVELGLRAPLLRNQKKPLYNALKQYKKYDDSYNFKLGKFNEYIFTKKGDKVLSLNRHLHKNFYTKIREKKEEHLSIIRDSNSTEEEKANAHHQLAHIENNEYDFQEAIKLGCEKAVLCLAKFYKRAGKEDKAIKYFKKAKKLGIQSANHHLAHLYEKKDITKAIFYYKKGLEAGDFNAIKCYGYFLYQNNLDKNIALSLKEYYLDKIDYLNVKLIYIIIQLWVDNIEEVNKYTQEVVRFHKGIESSLIIEFFLLLISKNNLHIAKKLFDNSGNLKQSYKPVWYTLMHYLKDDYPDEYLKMGSELKDTVEDMIARVEEMKIKYK